MYRRGARSDNPWEREPAIPNLSESHRRYIHEPSSKCPKFSKFECNRYPDDDTKVAALKALHSVVALTAYSNDIELNLGCGTIIESHGNTIILLTSANLIRRPTSKEFGENVLVDNIMVCAQLYDGHSYEGGEVYAYDFHYNIAVLRFVVETPFLPPFGLAKLACRDVSMDVQSSQPSFLHHPHSRASELTPGSGVIVLGRYFAEPFEPMTAPGEYWLERTKYDCKEVFMTNCIITRCGDGGPLINYHGEVIGVAFYDPDSTPCLPIDIASKWWEHYKKYRKCCRPFLGMEATSLNSADLGIIARVIQKFPNARKGIIVEKVVPDSSADLAGIHANDVIIQCGEKCIRSFLELFEMIWDNVGVPIELILVRGVRADVIPIRVNMVFAETTLDQLNSWPTHYNVDYSD